jgi:phosphoglucomutase
MSFTVKTIETTPIDGQKTGTSGLRKTVKVFEQKNYVENFIESLLLAVDEQDGGGKLKGATLVVGGDGRFYNKYVPNYLL